MQTQKEILIKPLSNINTEIEIPGSKSITNRALIIGALSDGKTVLKNILYSDDTHYMLTALSQLGIEIEKDEKRNEIQIQGRKGQLSIPSEPIFIGNAGTAMRFLTSLLTLGHGDFTLTGNERMKERPIQHLVEGLRLLGANISYVEKKGCPPLKIKANGLKGGKTKMKGEISSQFFSSLLLSGAYSEQGIEIEVIGDLVSKPYIDITSKIMEDFAVHFTHNNYQHFKVPPKQMYQHRDYIIEGDASNASYFFAAAAVTGGCVRVNNIDFSTKQGDAQFANILKQMGCHVEEGNNYIEVGGGELKAIDIDMRDMSDVVQTLAIVALFAKGKTVIRNVYNMRVKETDRLKALYNELTKLGAVVEEKEDGLVIEGKGNYHGAKIETYEDHRMAMSFSIAGLRIKDVVILDPGCVAKTFPNYFDKFNELY